MFRWAVALCAALTMMSCSLLKVAVSTGDPLSKQDSETRLMTRGFYHDMSAEIAQTADSIVNSSNDLDIRVAAIRWKMRATKAAVTAAMQSIPEVSLADTWILCRRMNTTLQATPDSLLFGPYSHLARTTTLHLEKRAHKLARQSLTAERYNLMERFVDKIIEENPSDKGDEAVNTTLAWIEFLKANGMEVSYAAGSISEVISDVNDRLTGQTRQIANSVGWSKDIFQLQLQQDSTRSALGARIDTLEHHFSRIVTVTEHLPEISDKALAEFDKQVHDILDAMQVAIDTSFADMSRQRMELQHYITAERQALITQFNDSAHSLVTTTLDAIPSLIGKALFFIVTGVLVLLGVPFALGFWLGGVRQRARDKKNKDNPQA